MVTFCEVIIFIVPITYDYSCLSHTIIPGHSDDRPIITWCVNESYNSGSSVTDVELVQPGQLY